MKGGCPYPIPSQFASAPPPKEKHYAASTPLSKTYFGTVGKVLYTNLRCRGIASAMPEEIIKVAKAENVYQVRAYCDIGNVPSHRLWLKNRFSIRPVKLPDGSVVDSFVSRIL